VQEVNDAKAFLKRFPESGKRSEEKKAALLYLQSLQALYNRKIDVRELDASSLVNVDVLPDTGGITGDVALSRVSAAMQSLVSNNGKNLGQNADLRLLLEETTEVQTRQTNPNGSCFWEALANLLGIFLADINESNTLSDLFQRAQHSIASWEARTSSQKQAVASKQPSDYAPLTNAEQIDVKAARHMSKLLMEMVSGSEFSPKSESEELLKLEAKHLERGFIEKTTTEYVFVENSSFVLQCWTIFLQVNTVLYSMDGGYALIADRREILHLRIDEFRRCSLGDNFQYPGRPVLRFFLLNLEDKDGGAHYLYDARKHYAPLENLSPKES